MSARFGAAAAVAVLALQFAAPALADSSQVAPGSRTHAHRSPMKATPMKPNGSGVAVGYQIDTVSVAGQPTSITLRFERVTDPAGATLRLSTDGGLTLNGAADRLLPAGATTTLTVDVVPSAGIGYLNVFTTQSGVTSVTSIPVQVGKAPGSMPASGEMKQDSAGEKIRALPVK